MTRSLPRLLTVLLSCSIINIFSISLLAQDLDYAKTVVGTLASEKMKGRGYVEQGDRTAAEYIAGEFEKNGLKKFGKSYFQNFSTSVNTFPGNMQLSINGKALIPGVEFLVDPAAPGIKGSFATVTITADDMLDDQIWMTKMNAASGKILVVNAVPGENHSKDQQKKIQEVTNLLQYNQSLSARGAIVLTNNKLTWSGSTEVASRPSFTVKASAISGPVETIELNVENKFVKNHSTQNVVGYVEGNMKDSLIVLTAHYDHLGMMGSQTMFPGANDNASGVAFLLNLVKHYSSQPQKYSIVFIAFAGEEIGLIGSQYFTSHPMFPLKKIKFLINFDMAGTGDDGIQVVNGKIYPAKFDLLVKLNTEGNLLKQIKNRGEACNSDHCMFHQKGVPCFFIYTLGGIQAYHDVYDKAETLPLTEFEDYFRLVTSFISKI
jgi:aminopeptidase YwaD